MVPMMVAAIAGVAIRLIGEVWNAGMVMMREKGLVVAETDVAAMMAKPRMATVMPAVAEARL